MSKQMRRTVLAAVLAAGPSVASEVFVMLPLTTITNEGNLNNPGDLSNKLDRLKQANVDGFMVDVWWGITEKEPKKYDFRAYVELVQMAVQKSMQVQFVASFHQCGGNVGDACDIPIPSWVLQQDGAWFKDREGHENREYISFWADDLTFKDGRTPVDMYGDWMQALSTTFDSYLGKTVSAVQVGLGPCGELRYPAYPLKYWNYPGVGEFQAYDDRAVASLKLAGQAKNWTGAPSDAGGYSSEPSQANFFKDGYKSDYGKFFMDWYFGTLKSHGSRVLEKASKVFQGRIELAAKVSGVHWNYADASHASEATAGYYNCNGRDAYKEIADIFAQTKTTLDFTCLEMRNSEQAGNAQSRPEDLVAQVQRATSSAGIRFSGENALPRYDWTAYEEIIQYKPKLFAFTYLRLDDKLLGDGYDTFKHFVQQMKSSTIETAIVV